MLTSLAVYHLASRRKLQKNISIRGLRLRLPDVFRLEVIQTKMVYEYIQRMLLLKNRNLQRTSIAIHPRAAVLNRHLLAMDL